MIDTDLLRKKVINLAIQGKLTQQLPADGNAEDLYAQIQAEKIKLIKECKIKKEKPFPEITDEEIPFEIPKNWKWVRIAGIGVTVTGNTPSKENKEYYGGDYQFYKPADLDAGRHITVGSEKLTEHGKNVARYLKSGTILVCCIGTIGKAAVIDNDGACNQQINALTPLLCDSDYLLCAIESDCFQKQLHIGSRATTVNIIKKSLFDACILPLPPMEEQKRIVDKLNSIIAQIEIVDCLQKQYVSDLDVLKYKIIYAGISGKLTKQLPEDENAEDLYAQVKNEKRRLIKAGKIKRERPLPDITTDVIPFDVPMNWKWVRVSEIAYLSSGKQYKETTEGELYIKVSDMNLPENEKHIITSTHFTKCSNSGAIPTNSIVFPKRGGAIATNKKRLVLEKPIFVDLNTMGMTVIVPETLMYIKYWFDTLRLDEIQNGTSVPQINTKDIYPLVLPLPPLSEQKRIVKILEDIMSCIGDLN